MSTSRWPRSTDFTPRMVLSRIGKKAEHRSDDHFRRESKTEPDDEQRDQRNLWYHLGRDNEGVERLFELGKLAKHRAEPDADRCRDDETKDRLVGRDPGVEPE